MKRWIMLIIALLSISCTNKRKECYYDVISGGVVVDTAVFDAFTYRHECSGNWAYEGVYYKLREAKIVAP